MSLAKELKNKRPNEKNLSSIGNSSDSVEHIDGSG
jgi:hypothetical protein